MKTFNKEITIEEARELVNSINMMYPDTEHNKKMIAIAIGEVLSELRK